MCEYDGKAGKSARKNIYMMVGCELVYLMIWMNDNETAWVSLLSDRQQSEWMQDFSGNFINRGQASHAQILQRIL